MQFYTANYYQIRNMPKSMLPLSINSGEPSWYHNDKGRSYIFKDKRGVWNGGYIDELSSANLDISEDFCHECHRQKYVGENCPVVLAHIKKLHKLNFENTILKLEKLAKHFDCDSICFVVYEKLDILCGERIAIKKWFKENNTQIEEFYPLKKASNDKFSLNYKKVN